MMCDWRGCHAPPMLMLLLMLLQRQRKVVRLAGLSCTLSGPAAAPASAAAQGYCVTGGVVMHPICSCCCSCSCLDSHIHVQGQVEVTATALNMSH